MDNKLGLGILLPIVFGNNEGNRMYNIILESLYNSDNNIKVNLLAKKILTEYEDMKNQLLLLNVELKEKVKTIIEYKRVLSNFKYNGIITNEQIELVEKIMEKYDFSVEDQIRVFESIRIHNIKNMYDEPKISYTVFNMLDTNFEKYDIEGYEEFCYIYESVINKIIDDLREGVQSISDPSIYQDQDLRKVVIQEYNENKFIYDNLQKIYKINRKGYLNILNQEKDNQVDGIDSNTISDIDKNIILYEFTSNKEVTYLERDLKKFPNEYLSKVMELLEKKKKDTLKPDEIRIFKSNNNILKGFEELRDDQVRIILKHLEGNYYCVIGAFVKKVNTPLNLFYNVAKRGCTIDISTSVLLEENLDKANKAEINIYDFIDKNARKGSR